MDIESGIQFFTITTYMKKNHLRIRMKRIPTFQDIVQANNFRLYVLWKSRRFKSKISVAMWTWAMGLVSF